MKFFVVFAAVAAVACATPTMWTMSALDGAIQNPTTSATFKPVLQNALDVFMHNLIQGHEEVPSAITTQAGSIGTFTLTELSHAIESEQIDAIFMPYFEKALNTMMTSLFSGQNMDGISVDVPAFTISAWTLQELDDAVTSSETNPKLLPYLKEALNKFVAAVFFGQTIDNIVVVAPADLFSAPAPASPEPVAVAEPVVQETPPAPAASASSPLVQIILNVQSNQAVETALPTPVIDRPVPEVVDRPVPEVVDSLLPAPVVDRPVPENTVNPIDVIAVLPIEDLHRP